MFASMTNLYNFGLITGVVVLTAMVTDLVLVGAMMKLIIKSDSNNESWQK
jgi:predicted RND superfamily exporter protein